MLKAQFYYSKSRGTYILHLVNPKKSKDVFQYEYGYRKLVELPPISHLFLDEDLEKVGVEFSVEKLPTNRANFIECIRALESQSRLKRNTQLQALIDLRNSLPEAPTDEPSWSSRHVSHVHVSAQLPLAENDQEPVIVAASSDASELQKQLKDAKAAFVKEANKLISSLRKLDVSGSPADMIERKEYLLKFYEDNKQSIKSKTDLSEIDRLSRDMQSSYEAFAKRRVNEFKLRKGRMEVEVGPLCDAVNRLPKTTDSEINNKIRQLKNELTQYQRSIAALTVNDQQKLVNLARKFEPYEDRWRAINANIYKLNILLPQLKEEARDLYENLGRIERELFITEELNEPLINLQTRVNALIPMLNQKDNQNLQILEENLAPFLRKKLRQSEEQLLKKFNDEREGREERIHEYVDKNPKFHLTKGGWIVEKIADKNKVIGQVVSVSGFPFELGEYVIKPITSSNREEAEKIERYKLSEVEIKEVQLTFDEIAKRKLSVANGMFFKEHKADVLPPLPPPITHGYYGFYKDSDVVGFAVADKDVPEAERSKLKFYPVGKHKVVNGKLTIQFDTNFDPTAWNVMATQLPAPNVLVNERRRYGHEDYATDFPMQASELSKVPRFNYFLCKGGIVLKFTEHEDSDKVEFVARWSLNKDNTQIQISAIDNASKQKYNNLLTQHFDAKAIPLKQYRPHLGLINFNDVISVRGLTIDPVTLTAHLNLPGKYYIYEGGHLVFHIDEGADERKFVLGKCELDGNKIKFIFTDTLPTDDVIAGKKHASLVVTNTDYADYSGVNGGVPHAILDLLPETERKKEFDKRLLVESRHYSAQPQPDVVLGAVESSDSLVGLDPATTDKTPGDLYLYNSGIVVEEKTINGKVEKKVVGRWRNNDDEVQMLKISPEEEASLQGLLDLPDYPKAKVKVPNQSIINLWEFENDTRDALKENRYGKLGYYRFEGDGSVWFCPKDQVKEPNGFFASSSRKRQRESDYPFYFVGHWELSNNNEIKVTYEADPTKKYAREDRGYFRLLTKDRTVRTLGHEFTAKDFRPEELAEVMQQMKKYSVDKVSLAEREKALSNDNKAWHISLKRKEYSVSEDTYSGASKFGRHIIMTPADPATRTSRTFWHDTKNNTIGIPPGISIDQQMIDKYVELAGHFCKPKLDASAEPVKMAIRFSASVRDDIRSAIVEAIERAYPAIGNITIANDEAHFKQLLSKDKSVSQSQPNSPRLST